MRNRFVKAERASIAGELHHSYQAVELKNGLLYPLGAKFMHEPLAWAQIDDIEARERVAREVLPACPERCDCKACRPELYVQS